VTGRRPKPPTTVYLGRYTWEHANAIAERLEGADIVWWYKQPGFLSEVWEFGGIRLFVDRDRLEDARAIADGIAPDGTARKRRTGRAG
jgi:hypothetical protein